jgi:hypothetical protein
MESLQAWIPRLCRGGSKSAPSAHRSALKHPASVAGIIYLLVWSNGCMNESALEERERPEVGSAGAEIRGGNDVTPDSPYSKSTVSVGGGQCTGTIIAPRYVLTAAHCGITAGNTVSFYGGSRLTGQSVKIVRIFHSDGVTKTQQSDSSGYFADWTVAELGSDIPGDFRSAALPSTWPGNNVSMIQVGQGDHDGYANTELVLRYRSTWSYAASNADGSVLVEACTDAGDSGGPIYTSDAAGNLTVHGANYGNALEWAWHGKYTSTAFHIEKILAAMGHKRFAAQDFPGSDIAIVSNVVPIDCAIRCMQLPACKAYTHVSPVPLPWFPGTCSLKSGHGTAQPAVPGVTSGVKEPDPLPSPTMDPPATSPCCLDCDNSCAESQDICISNAHSGPERGACAREAAKCRKECGASCVGGCAF